MTTSLSSSLCLSLFLSLYLSFSLFLSFCLSRIPLLLFFCLATARLHKPKNVYPVRPVFVRVWRPWVSFTWVFCVCVVLSMFPSARCGLMKRMELRLEDRTVMPLTQHGCIYEFYLEYIDCGMYHA